LAKCLFRTGGLKYALSRAKESECSGPYSIYVAQGIYKPGQYESSSFVLPDETLLYGGFETRGCDFTERNPQMNITVLTGYIEDDTIAETLLKMGDDTLLDGFVVNGSQLHAIKGENSDISVENCVIQNSSDWAVYASNGNITLNWCSIINNHNGLFHLGINKDMVIDHCEIIKNNGFGIYAENNIPSIKHSVVWDCINGVQIKNPHESPVLYNNTIGLNEGYGLYFTDNHNSLGDPNILDYPDMDSCIVWYNNEQVQGSSGQLCHKLLYSGLQPS
jgi:hypothetical protein